MENKNTGERSPIMIIGGLVVIIVITLGVLGLIAIQQRPVEVAGNAPVADAATPVSETAAVTETTTTAAVTDTATSAVTTTVTAVVTDTATTAVTDTTSAAVTTTAAVSGTAAPVTTTTPVTAATAVTATAPVSAAAPAAGGSVDIAAVTAAVTKGTCVACHTIPGIPTAVGMIGPDLATIGTNAGTRIAGTTAEDYLRQSILDPNAFIAPKCPTGDCVPGLMLPNLADILTPAEIDLIISYLLTLK